MFKYLLIALLILFEIRANGASPIHGWASVSSLWGQGGAGISYETNRTAYCVSDFFSYDISQDKVEYNEVEFLVQKQICFGGLRLREQNNESEIAPFVGRHDYFHRPGKVSFSIHNEVEWREKSSDSYVRTQHGLTLFPLDIQQDEVKFRFFVSAVPFFDWESLEVEKARTYVGYSMAIDKYKMSLYYIPYRWGKLEKEWDDQNDFGVSMKISF